MSNTLMNVIRKPPSFVSEAITIIICYFFDIYFNVVLSSLFLKIESSEVSYYNCQCFCCDLNVILHVLIT